MNFGEMLGFTIRFKEIIQSKLPKQNKTMRLSYLMSDLEGAYSIPLKNEQFEKDHPQLMQLYRTVSEAREF